jgi:hypothetical protein
MAQGLPRIPKLNETNFYEWRRLLRAVAIEKGYWSAINPPMTEQQELDGIDAKMTALIAMHVEAQYGYLIHDDDTAPRAWERINGIFVQRAMARAVQLRRQLTTLVKNPKETVTTYVNRAEEIRNQLVLAGQQVDEAVLLQHICAGLPKAFDNVVENFPVDGDVPTLLSRLQVTEARINSRSDDHRQQED